MTVQFDKNVCCFFSVWSTLMEYFPYRFWDIDENCDANAFKKNERRNNKSIRSSYYSFDQCRDQLYVVC